MARFALCMLANKRHCFINMRECGVNYFDLLETNPGTWAAVELCSENSHSAVELATHFIQLAVCEKAVVAVHYPARYQG